MYNEEDLACKCCGEMPENGIDQKLISVLEGMSNEVGSKLELSCAYRCPSHNEEVGGVPNSQHVQGCAADVILPDSMTIDELADLAERHGADGIGKYYDSQFVHVDTRGYEARWDG